MKCDFLIVGAGMAGAAAAYWLSRKGSVALIEMEAQAGYHTTGRSAAIYLPSYGAPPVRALTKASYEFLSEPPADLAIEHRLLEPRDVLYIAPDDKEQELAAFVAEMQAQSNAVESIATHEALARVPVLRSEYVRHAAIERGTYDIDVAGLHQGMLRAIRGRGGAVHLNRTLQRVVRTGGAGWSVQAGEVEIEARYLINAAGAWADEVARMAGAAPVGLAPLRRTLVTVDCDHPRFSPHWPVVEAIGEWIYFKPESGKLLASCGDETPWAPSDVQPDELDVAITIDRLEQATSLTVRRVAAQWAGLRTFAADRIPVVGRDTHIEDFFWLAGLGGFGIQTAPALGMLLAALVTSAELPRALVEQGVRPADFAASRLV